MLIEVFDKDGKLLDSWETDALSHKDSVVVIDNDTPGIMPSPSLLRPTLFQDKLDRTNWLPRPWFDPPGTERKPPTFFTRELDNLPYKREAPCHTKRKSDS